MVKHKKIAVVINGNAGRVVKQDRGRQLQLITHLFSSVDLKVDLFVTAPSSMLGVIRELKAVPVDTIVVGGGDGTLSAAANLLVNSGISIGILPLGTFNHFARDIGIPLDLKHTVDILARGTIQTIDVGEMNGRYFVNNASIGVHPHLIEKRKRYQQQWGLSKWMAANYALFRVFMQPPRLNLRLHIDTVEESIHTPFVLLGNNLYEAKSFGLPSRRSLSHGQLSIFFTPQTNRWTIFNMAVQAIIGRSFKRLRNLNSAYSEKVKVICKRESVRLAMDGEVLDSASPLAFRIHPQALRVIMPKPLS